MAYFSPQQQLREVPIEPKQTTLLFIDVQNFNCHRGGAIYRHYTTEQLEGPEFQYFWARVEQVTPNWQRLQAGCRAIGVEVMYTVIQSLTKDGRDRSLDYKITGFHVPPGSWDAKVLECIRPDDDEMIIPKTSSSVFLSTNIDYILRSMEKKFLVICGCVTDQCVEHAVRDACDMGYYVTLVPDCCATYSQDRHDSALQAIKGYCRIRMLDELLEEMRVFKGKAARPIRAQGMPVPVGVSPKVSGIKHERASIGGPLGMTMIPQDDTPSGKRDRKVYFEYAKQSWEEEDEFKLPNGETWVEVHIKGDPSTGERGLVYCKLCRSQERNNIFGKGYRAGKRSALREHMVTKDHKELVEMVMRSVASVTPQNIPMLAMPTNGLSESPVMDPQQLQQQHVQHVHQAQLQHTPPQQAALQHTQPPSQAQLQHTSQSQLQQLQQQPMQHTPQSVDLQHSDMQAHLTLPTPALVPE